MAGTQAAGLGRRGPCQEGEGPEELKGFGGCLRFQKIHNLSHIYFYFAREVAANQLRITSFENSTLGKERLLRDGRKHFNTAAKRALQLARV